MASKKKLTLQATNNNSNLTNMMTTSNYINASASSFVQPSISGNYTINSWSTDYFGINGLEEFAKGIIYSKTEAEIAELISAVEVSIKNSVNGSTADDIMCKVVAAILGLRHFSEDFILNHLSFLEKDHITSLKDTLFQQHKADILSGSYSTLALKIMVDDN